MAAAKFYAKGASSLDEMLQRVEGVLLIGEGEDFSLPYPLSEEMAVREEGLFLMVPIFILPQTWGGGAMGSGHAALEVTRVLVREA